MGSQVVATYNRGSEEIITSDGYGLLCEPANPEELAEKIFIALDKGWDNEKIWGMRKGLRGWRLWRRLLKSTKHY